jgi:methionyl-tRNA formyltransferase
MNVIFMGTPDFSVPILQKLLDDRHVEVIAVVTQPDRPKGRKRMPVAPPVKTAAAKRGIPVMQPEKIKNPEAVRKIMSYRPDLLITAAYGQILPEALLKEPPFGCINVHASLLPEYRGAAPIQQAIIDGKKETGVTIMYMVRKLDAGDIIAQTKVPIDEEDTFGTLHDKLSAAGAELLIRLLPEIAERRAPRRAQDESRVSYAPQIKRADEVIDWTKHADDVRNLIRGLNPTPGASTLLDGKVFKIFAAELGNVTGISDPPGTILQTTDDGFLVAAGSGSTLKVTECQPAGKKRMRAADFLRGAHLPAGSVFGERS